MKNYLEQLNGSLNQIIDKDLLSLLEAENPDFNGATYSASPIPGTPSDLQPRPSPKQIRKKKLSQRKMEKWVQNTQFPKPYQ